MINRPTIWPIEAFLETRYAKQRVMLSLKKKGFYGFIDGFRFHEGVCAMRLQEKVDSFDLSQIILNQIIGNEHISTQMLGTIKDRNIKILSNLCSDLAAVGVNEDLVDIRASGKRIKNPIEERLIA